MSFMRLSTDYFKQVVKILDESGEIAHSD